MDEDLLKRNTDCVYFLASPLTCKKGVDCEYRHNEIARLNPRDCWYWLSGNCLNPTCAFRHPPLEGHTGVPSEPTQSSLPANKTVPCYFFFNGFCNKGDRCSFLHGPDYSSFPGKAGKNDCGSNDALPSENKTSSGNKAGVAMTTETCPDPSEIAPKALHNCKIEPVEDPQRSILKNLKQQNTSPEISAYEYKEATVIRPDPVYPDKDFIHGISHMCTDQSPDERVHNHMEPEERLESPPGFDVLVDDEMESPTYGDDSEYLPVDREYQELNGQYLQYEFKDTVEYDPECSEAEADILYEEMHGGYRFMDGDHILADDRRVPAFSRERIIDSILSRKRIRMPAEMTACNRNLDLRDHLRRRREINGGPVTGFLRRRESSCMVIQNRERLRRHGSFDQRLSRRLTSAVGFNTIASNGEDETRSISNRHRLFRHPLQHSSRKPQHYRENRGKRQFVPSKIFRNPFSKQRRYTASTDIRFHGPKSLAEIKEEKATAAERGHFNSTSTDFQDPKPLSEILKDKKRLDCG
ncbi:zinc finger CCCH domain-containing protein 17 [Neltuma alba]|uniref:zinc finger CCCH domain-containing protein 17 n=1 Tax=Neltuma alba TaxID=207710 RepID=UPI0010A4970A|nr:zinc finger CCCH domain-containing protein 17-like [Prosopis alba]